MAWGLVGSTPTTITAGAGNQSITLPGPPVAGDLVLVAVAGDISCQNSIQTADYVTPENGTGANPGAHFGYKVMPATPDTAVLIARNATILKSCVVQVWRGGRGILDAAYVGAITGTSANPDPPAIVTNTSNALVVAIAYLDDDDTTVSVYPSSYTNGVEVNTGQASTTVGSTMAFASRIVASPTTENPSAYTMGTSDAWLAATIAFREGETSTESVRLSDEVTADRIDPPGEPLSRDVPPEGLRVSDTITAGLTPLLATPADEGVRLADSAVLQQEIGPQPAGASVLVPIGSAPQLLIWVTERPQPTPPTLELSITPEQVRLSDSATGELVTEGGDLSREVTAEGVRVSETVSANFALEATKTESLRLSDAVTVSLTPLLGTPADESLRVRDDLPGSPSFYPPDLYALLLEGTTGGSGLIGGPGSAPGGILPGAPPSVGGGIRLSETVAAELIAGDEDLTAPLLTEHLRLSDTVAAQLDTLLVTLTENVRLADVLDAGFGLAAEPNESIRLSDSIFVELTVLERALTESVRLSDAVQAELTVLERALTESVRVSETVSVESGLSVLQLESLRVSDGPLSPELDPLLLTIAESLRLSDLVAGSIGLDVTVAEGLRLSDSAAGELTVLQVSVSETVGIHESDVEAALIEAGALATNLLETVLVSDSVTGQVSRIDASALENLRVSDSAAAELSVLETALAESLRVSDTISVVVQLGVAVEDAVLVADTSTGTLDPLRTAPSEAVRVNDSDLSVARSELGGLLVVQTEGLLVSDEVVSWHAVVEAEWVVEVQTDDWTVVVQLDDWTVEL